MPRCIRVGDDGETLSGVVALLLLVLALPVDLPEAPNRLVAAFFSAASRRAALLLAAVAPLLVVEERPARVVLPLPLPLPLLPDLATTRSD